MAGKKKKWAWIAAAALLIGVVGKGLDHRPVVRRYEVKSEKLTQRVRLVFLSDLHSCDYGTGQSELLELVEAQGPDLVLLGGDWVDDEWDRLSPERAYTAARALAERWPTYYVTGNHEIWSGQAQQIKVELAALGVTVLSGESTVAEAQGQRLQICGLDDPDAGENVWRRELETLRRGREEAAFTILLTHRPERAEDYGGFDLTLSGHAHGGQWRIPGLVNGLLAPDQGFFPAYAGGVYPVDGGGTLLVGRGLARESTRVPRFYNPPEVVVAELVPAL
ncbi:MAG: metallophosphoesterase [Lachnospirales bacterium]